ncbi:hypothetical protein QP178_19905 [Sphingomonas aurantiaca]|jgi:hypothetical protein|uniref:Uncharacterized protein n=1 Tax=Sphingomonas aurantiaca TaxID=185949 RepID=A0A2T5GG90_9SPHN|nr:MULTISPECIES: hypothetical protein [Sphingomonas]PTQ58352.1 hypothetical protein C8J26_3953 [Sphingomonas aurantiaca]
MTKTSTTSTTRKPWVRPAVQKIAAGAAETGTRTTSDGAFTTS